MGSRAQEPNDFLRRPLYVFGLPQELLLSIRSRDVTEISPEVENDEAKRGENSTRPQDDVTPSSTSCAFCGVSFPNVIEQRGHVRSDFHRYNLKLKLKKCPPVDEPTFNRLIGDLDESLSGSESSDPDLEEYDQDEKSQESILAALLKRQSKISQPLEDENDSPFNQRKRGAGNAPLLWLSSSKLTAETSLGVYRALFTNAEQNDDLVEAIKKKQLQPVQAKTNSSVAPTLAQEVIAQTPHYFLCMLGGGHFAAMVVSLAPEIRKGPGGQEDRHVIVKAHKTFHRYTTRRKQGGSQAASDNAKGNAHSAGSSIRRYNERALEADIRGVLSDWKDTIEKSELLFIRAAGPTSRRTLYGPYDGQVLRPNDARLRGFPFSTRRATQAELMRSFIELTRLQVSTVSPSALNEASVEREKVIHPEKPRASAREPTPKPSAEDEASMMHTLQIQTLIRRTKAPALLTYLTNNGLSPNFSFFPPNTPQHHHAPTALHLAASDRSPALVLALLTKAKADATLVNGDGRTAFDVAGDVKTRDAFRIARHLRGEAAVDWEAAHVPTALSQQDAEDRQQKEKAQEDAAEAQRRKNDLEKLRYEEEAQRTGKIERRAGTGHSLGSRDKTGAEKREEEGRGLTPEMRMKLERERRARAAEERIKKMQGK